MSGHAAVALVLLRARGRFATLTICPLGEPILPGQGESPFPVDFYLSWMSRNVLFYAVNSLSMALITRAAEPGFPGLGRGRWRLSPCASAINDPARSFASMGISFDKALK
jgi:hypothetical protein